MIERIEEAIGDKVLDIKINDDPETMVGIYAGEPGGYEIHLQTNRGTWRIEGCFGLPTNVWKI
jgi:hypothetical protein